MTAWQGEHENYNATISAACAASAACASLAPTYCIVDVIERCPSTWRANARLTFSATKCDASECFKTCGWRFSSAKRASAAIARKMGKNWVLHLR